MFRFKVLLISFILVSGVAAQAEVHEVKMLSNLKGQSMVFEPPVIKVKPGDSVKWIASNPGHNTASIDEMLPEGTQSWNGGLNEELVVKFDKEGVYGYKCTPHYILGMVGLVVVGDGSSNFDRKKHWKYKKTLLLLRIELDSLNTSKEPNNDNWSREPVKRI